MSYRHIMGILARRRRSRPGPLRGRGVPHHALERGACRAETAGRRARGSRGTLLCLLAARLRLCPRPGHNPDEARDLTQAFFAQFLEAKRVQLADPARGRFRSYLIALLKNFLTTEWRRGQAEKRGGGKGLISLEAQQEVETHLRAEPADPATTPTGLREALGVLLLDLAWPGCAASTSRADEQIT